MDWGERVIVWISAAAFAVSASQVERPNVVLIVADDLGWGDVGAFGQRRIRTPHVDRLATEGMRFVRHYSGSPVCAPSRCVLMTGKHPGRAFIRDNRQYGGEGQYPIPDEVLTMAEILQSLGYATGAFGKWGLGGPTTSGAPLRQGFDRFFGYNSQSHAHNYYPTNLWDDDRRVDLDNPPFSAQQTFPADADPDDPAAYERYRGKEYSADRIAAEAVRYLHAHKDRPFFLFIPSTIPHLALQAPDDALARYQGAFDETPYLGDRRYLPHRTPRACYAAMASRLDDHVGEILRTLDELGLTDRTIVAFTSDNGPVPNGLGGADTEFFDSAGGLRGRKGSVYEGGVRVPLIVRWPGKIAAGAVSDRVTGFEDWLPTILDLVSAAESIPADVDGVSFAPTLLGRRQAEREFLYREFPGSGGQQAAWAGRWKAVRQNLNKLKPGQRPTTELYDLEADPRETVDVAGRNPEVVRLLESLMRSQHVPSSEFPIPAIDAEQ
jgi:arylsulfatase A-like enzyme